MNIKEYKDYLRKEIKQKRMLMTREDVIEKSNIICQKILNHKIYQNSECIYCYYPVQNEVDILPVIIHALNNGKIIALPKVVNKQGKMIFAEIDNLDNLKTGHFNIPEPIITVQARKADLVLVPGVVFSSKGERIGQAGGFYDRFLETYHPYTIGVAYDFQMMNDIKTQPHDIDVCEVISNI
ncbi:MAG: 5-formyltetrahydrofolate cyclo-ligase [Eubacterium sp.]|nr:5-formyltetrahydrofolate cyclo-ligase [Eubacterium sp.]